MFRPPLLAVAAMASIACAASPRAEERQDGIDQARALLASRVPSEIAWAAFEAGERHWTELAPDVVLALTQAIDSPESKEQAWVVRSLLDAAIQLGARPRPADLAKIEEHMAALASATLILAAREPEANVALLESLEPGRADELWIAVVNLLAEHAPARIAPRLVEGARISIALEVVDPGSSLGSGGRTAYGIGCGGLSAPPGFPPTAVYSLRRRPPDAADVFAGGPIAIGFERLVHTESSFGIGCRATPVVERRDYDLLLLRWMVGDRGDPGLLASEAALRHEWHGADAYVEGVAAEIDARRAAWVNLLRSLRAAGSIDEARVATPLPFELEIEDRRADRSVPLPPLPR